MKENVERRMLIRQFSKDKLFPDSLTISYLLFIFVVCDYKIIFLWKKIYFYLLTIAITFFGLFDKKKWKPLVQSIVMSLHFRILLKMTDLLADFWDMINFDTKMENSLDPAQHNSNHFNINDESGMLYCTFFQYMLLKIQI